MRSPTPRSRLLVGAVVAAALGALAAGIVVGRGDSSARAQGAPGVVAEGAFRSVGWGTTGTAAIVRDETGRLKLRLSSAFTTQPAPELYVYLVRYRNGRRVEWKQVGLLQRAWGRQDYTLSSDAAGETGASVAIYCGKCNKISGLARLSPTRS